jgi:mRNA-degrading endonuclease RelE of RelBE toxin-antitoxin system
MVILQSARFSRSVKKLHPNQKIALDKAVKQIIADPKIGEAKVADLAGTYILKFKVANSKWLLAYEIQSRTQITLLLVGAHENFYKIIKRG